MNITLSADAELIKQSREYAKAHNTSLNQLVRDYLAQLAGGYEPAGAADEFVRLASSMPGRSEQGYKFARDAVHDRHAGG